MSFKSYLFVLIYSNFPAHLRCILALRLKTVRDVSKDLDLRIVRLEGYGTRRRGFRYVQCFMAHLLYVVLNRLRSRIRICDSLNR